MATKTTKHLPFTHTIIGIYENFTGKEADQGKAFAGFLKDSAVLLGHRIESGDSVKKMVWAALKEREAHRR